MEDKKIVNKDKFSNRNYSQLLKKLSKAEIEDLEVFIRMPSHRLNESHFALFKELKNAWPSLLLNKHKLQKNLFGNTKSNPDTALNKALWQLFQCTEKWLLYNQGFETEEGKNHRLAAAYAQRNLPQMFFKKNGEAINQTAINKQESSAIFYQRNKLYEQLYYHPDTSKVGTDIPAFRQMNQNLDYFYHASKLLLLAEQLVRKTFVTDEEYPVEENAHIAFAADNRALPYFDFFYELIYIIKNHNNSSLKKIIEKFKRQRSIFSTQKQMEILNILLNRIAVQINLGFSEFYKIQFDLYQYGLVNDLIVVNGRMTFASYNNIFSATLLMKEYKLAEKMLKKYQALLIPDLRDDAFGFLYAKLCFFRKEYHDAIALLRGMKFRDKGFKLLGKGLELRCAYELFVRKKVSEDFVIGIANSFYKFIKTNKELSLLKKTMYLNFVKFCKTIVKQNRKASSVVFRKKKELQSLLANDEYEIVLRTWLQSKVDAL